MNTCAIALLLSGAILAGSATACAKDSAILPVTVRRPMVDLVSNVIFEQVPSRGYPNVAMPMDILIPKTEGKKPAILFIPGGGFINANKDKYIQERMKLAEHGYVVASMTYRVAPTVQFPAPLQDVKAAIRFLRAHADQYGIDKNHIGVFGGSAGGYLAAMAGTTSGHPSFDSGDYLDESSDVEAVVDLYGLSDLTQVGADYSDDVKEKHRSPGATEALWVNGSPVFGGKDGGIPANPEGAKKANPITYISDKTPPFLLMHGDKDVVVSPSQTDLLYQALQKKGIPSTRYVVPGAAHGGEYWVQDEVMDKIISFFDTYLKGQEA